MQKYLCEEFGNASSSGHSYGWATSMAVEKSRKQVSSLIGCKPNELVFTSGATESNNMAIVGTALNHKSCHIITSAIEHKAVLDVCKYAQRFSADVTILQPDAFGRIQPEDVKNAIQENTRLISLMFANNEIGSLNPIKEIGAIAKEKSILFHTDAAQAFGKVSIDVNEMNIDLLSISGHKIYGPKGVGALYIRKGVELTPLIVGGQQEQGLRPGTLNVAGIVGLGEASELAAKNAECTRLFKLRDQIIKRVLEAVPEAQLNGHPTERLCNNISFSFKGLSSDIFTLGLSGLALSSGSACTSGSPEPSHVLKGIGHTDDLARATIRIGIGFNTTEEEVNTAIEKIIAMAEKNRKL